MKKILVFVFICISQLSFSQDLNLGNEINENLFTLQDSGKYLLNASNFVAFNQVCRKVEVLIDDEMRITQIEYTGTGNPRTANTFISALAQYARNNRWTETHEIEIMPNVMKMIFFLNPSDNSGLVLSLVMNDFSIIITRNAREIYNARKIS